MNWRYKGYPGHHCPTVHGVYIKAWCVFIFCCRIQLWIWLAQVLCSLWRWWGPKLWPDTHWCRTSGFSEMSYAGLYKLKYFLNLYFLLRVGSRGAVLWLTRSKWTWRLLYQIHCCKTSKALLSREVKYYGKSGLIIFDSI